MDKRFFSKNNVKNLLQRPLKSKFLLALPWTLSFAREQAERERESIDKPEHTIFFGKEVPRGVSRRVDWPGMRGYVAGLVELAEKNPADKRFRDEFGKYLSIKKAAVMGKVVVSIRSDVLRKELQHVGWMVLISNHVKDPERR
jgi:transposase